MARSLEKLTFSQLLVAACKRFYLKAVWKMDIGSGAVIASGVNLDRINPRGIHIGADTFVAYEAAIQTYDAAQDADLDTWIGKNCYIGERCTILPGKTVGDNCILRPGTVVTKDIPSGSIAQGHPARVVESGIQTKRHGQQVMVATPDAADAKAEAKPGESIPPVEAVGAKRAS